MMFMLLFMIVMTFMLMSEGIRTSMGSYADPFLSGWLPEEKWFVLTVLFLVPYRCSSIQYFEISSWIQFPKLTLVTDKSSQENDE